MRAAAGPISRAKTALKAVIPDRHRETVRFAGYRALNFGLRRFCPSCGSYVRRFLPFGEVPRPEARCPVCGALERHRAVSLFFRRHAALLHARRILHVAPEPQISRLLRQRDADYLSIDLDDGSAMVRMDVTSLDLPDASFDAIYCSHVLEHVPRDRRALDEFRRVLRVGGWAVIQVPIKGPVTFEPPVDDPEERRRLFGQSDHVRVYGHDFEQRLRAAGFAVEVDRPAALLPVRDVRRLGLSRGDAIHLCRKVN